MDVVETYIGDIEGATRCISVAMHVAFVSDATPRPLTFIIIVHGRGECVVRLFRDNGAVVFSQRASN